MNRDDSQAAYEWPDAKKYPRSIRFHISLYVAGVILLLMIVSSFIVSEKYASVVTRSIVEQLLAQARSYSSSAAKHFLTTDSPDVLMLNNICRRLSDESKYIYWAAITDAKGDLVAHTDVRQIASVGRLPKWPTSGEQELLRDDEAYTVVRDTVRIRVPIRERQLTVGQLELAASAAPIRLARRQALITMTSITLAVLLLGLPLTMLLMHRKLRPISVITEHLRNTKLGNLDINIPIETKNEFGYLADTLWVMGHKVREAQLATVERERMAKELEIAHEIQASILPKSFPEGPEFETYGFYQSAREVGGDYFDFIEIDSEHIGFLVADVSGKSLPGMLVMLLTRDIVRQASRHITDPARLLNHVNRELRPDIRKGMFVTMFFGVLNRVTGRFEFASAGHNPLLHAASADGSVSTFRPKGYPLGLMPPKQFDERIEPASLTLKEGDILVQFTDGINEAQDGNGEEFGMDRFVSTLGRAGELSPRQVVESVMNTHNDFVGSADQYDDITLVAVKWRGKAADNSTEGTGQYSYERQKQNA